MHSRFSDCSQKLQTLVSCFSFYRVRRDGKADAVTDKDRLSPIREVSSSSSLEAPHCSPDRLLESIDESNMTGSPSLIPKKSIMMYVIKAT